MYFQLWDLPPIGRLKAFAGGLGYSCYEIHSTGDPCSCPLVSFILRFDVWMVRISRAMRLL